MAKNKQKIKTVLQLKKRKHNKEQRKMDHAMESSFISAEQEKDSVVHQVTLVKKALTFIYLKYLIKKETTARKAACC